MRKRVLRNISVPSLAGASFITIILNYNTLHTHKRPRVIANT